MHPLPPWPGDGDDSSVASRGGSSATAYGGRLLHSTASTASSDASSSSAAKGAAKSKPPSATQKTQEKAADALSTLSKAAQRFAQTRDPGADTVDAEHTATLRHHELIKHREAALQAVMASLEMIDKRSEHAKDDAEREHWAKLREVRMAELQRL